MPTPEDTFNKLISAAVRAASGDNVQPWRFETYPLAGRLSVCLDPTRDTSPINAGQRMSRIACGAALENLVRTARRMGLILQQEASPDGALAHISIRNLKETSIPLNMARDEVLEERCTNRRFYDRRLVPDSVLATLRATCFNDQGVNTHFLTDAKSRSRIGNTDARATALMYLQPSIRLAMSENIRLKLPAREVPVDGLSRASLEISAIECLAFQWMFKSPNWALRCSGALKAMEWHFRRLHRSASGHCLITARDDSEQSDVLVGRAMQRAWLALTQQGLAAQPMMSVLVLDGVRKSGEQQLVEAIGHERIAALVNQFKTAFKLKATERPAFLLRFGYAPPPTGRSGRRPLADVIRQASSTRIAQPSSPTPHAVAFD